jgi:putative transposase
MTSHNSQAPLLAELTPEEREEAMERYGIIAPLLEKDTPSPADWQAAAEQADCSVKTIRRWVQRFRQYGLPGLCRKRRSDRNQRRAVSPDMQRVIEALYLEHGFRSMRAVHRMITSYAHKRGGQAPSYTVVREICQALPPDVVCMAREGEQAWRNRFEPILRHESNAPNERWQMDHCKLDVMIIDPQNGKVLGRPWLTLILDTYSRAVMGYHLGIYQPSSMVVCLALRQAIWHKAFPEWPMRGIPKQLHLDQGKDFTSHHLEQVAADLGITLIFATPYLARAKGKIERLFRTLNQQLWCELPGYVGPNIERRPPNIEPSLTLNDIEHYLLAYLIGVYHHRTHSTTGETPFARWQAYEFAPRMPDSLRKLDLLLMMSTDRVVHRDGIHLHSICYWAEELIDYIDQRVQVRYDPQDVATVIVYQDNQFLCAAFAPELSNLKISLREWKALRSQQRKSVKAVVSDYKALLVRERKLQLPLPLSIEEVDAVILLERLQAANQSSRLVIFPSNQPKPMLTDGKEKPDG